MRAQRARRPWCPRRPAVVGRPRVTGRRRSPRDSAAARMLSTRFGWRGPARRARTAARFFALGSSFVWDADRGGACSQGGFDRVRAMISVTSIGRATSRARP
jgi:hypothetical protein